MKLKKFDTDVGNDSENEPMQIYPRTSQNPQTRHMKSSEVNARSRWLQFVADEDGALGTVEFLLLATIIVIGLLAGMVEYRDQLVLEYGDTSAAIASINQSYAVDWNGDGDTNDPGETFTDTIPATVTLDGNGIDVSTSASAEND